MVNYLKTGLKDNLLPLETDVLGPLHEPGMTKVKSPVKTFKFELNHNHLVVAAS